ncbi:hypothetical protein JAAARDRAFT_125636, partial [Jaapia argillacea MUCL 33604]
PTSVPSHNTTEMICRPFGRCQPCPEDALHQPFCQPFGNRRLMHCFNASLSHPPPPPSHVTPPIHHPPNLDDDDDDYPAHPEGEIPAWQSCGRIVEQERADFWEFIACNIAFAAVSLFVLLARSRRLQAQQARQLAARIGLVRG